MKRPARPRAAADPAGYHTAVYINCPFDDDYRELMHAIVFAVVCCGLSPRSALTNASVAETRIERIAQELSACRLSIHDLSRIEADVNTGVARLNMPLELGMAMALHRAPRRVGDPPKHDWTALVLEGSAYQRALSDANGNDLQRYSNTDSLVSQVMNWLSPRLGEVQLQANPRRVVGALPRLKAALRRESRNWFEIMPWIQIVEISRLVAQDGRLLPPEPPPP